MRGASSAVVSELQNDQLTLQDGEHVSLSADTQFRINVKDGAKIKVKAKGSRSVNRNSVVVVSITISRQPPVIGPPRTDLCVNPAGKVIPCPPGNPPPFHHLGDQGENEHED